MNWEVFTYGGGEFLRLVFNGVAAITGNGGYITALKMTAIIGLLWVLIEGAFKHRAMNLQWLLGVILVYNGFMVPKVDVIITDRIDPTQSSVVSNVPLGLGAVAGTASLVGDWLTRAYETVFSLPSDMQYQQNGMLFGQYLVEASTRFEITDSRLAANFSEFWQSCVFYDILLGLYDWDDLFVAPDLWAFIRANTSVSRSFAYRDAANNRLILGCRDGANNQLDTDLTNDVDRARQYYGEKLVKAPTANAAVAKFAAAMPVSYQYLTGLSVSAEEIIRQNALSNALRRGLSQFASSAGAPAAAQDFALARAEQERRTTYAALGEMAGRTLPILRNLFEAFIYAVFPIAFLLAMLPSVAKVALTYLKSLVWIQLWAPLYAVLHFAMSLYSQNPASSALLLPDGSSALSLANYTALGQVMSDAALIAGYLSLSIPMISYLVVNQGGAMMASLASRVAQSYEAPVGKASDEASTGNISLGNTSIGNAGWWQQNQSPSWRAGTSTMAHPATGAMYTTTPEGRYVDVPQSNLPFSANIGDAVKSSVHTQATESLQAARTQVADYANLVSANYSNMERFTGQTATETGVNLDWNRAEMAAFRREFGETQRLADEFGKNRGYSASQAAEMLGLASLAAQNPKLLDLVSPVSLRAELNLRGRSDAQIKEDWQDALRYVQDTQYGKHWQAAIDAGHTAAAGVHQRTGDSLAEELSGGLQEQISHRHATIATLQEAAAWQEARSRVEEQGFAFSADVAMQVRDHMIGAEKGVFARPGSLDPTWSERDVDALFARAAAGDAMAMRVIAHYADEYGRQEGLELTGVQDMPTKDAVFQKNEAYMGEVYNKETDPGGIRDRAAGFREAARHAAEHAGVPADGQVRRGFADIQKEAEEDRAAHAQKVDQGERRIRTDGAALQSDTEARTDPENQTLLADSIKNGVTQALPSKKQLGQLKDRFFREDDEESTNK
ncbi:conjugal transfer protein TraG N-terminal domain-containing protein [Thiohalobacter sp. IOR34]|uniref:conjugal transfer protein TraG N-terminal domain-containing protein n=1 Tax=Thiohalobacter sp. IOR34 TaxID=3057176 RepID=UPI0025B03E6A|nr:conjugal transfer protein TraG N-terminal domain-containing protein [Thiohalobacter sp. IOR34]WJW74711.1 conjugal transfer protein TraG N-terminal domain-containing protein [Thiohalobacter sp. IOR34]